MSLASKYLKFVYNIASKVLLTEHVKQLRFVECTTIKYRVHTSRALPARALMLAFTSIKTEANKNICIDKPLDNWIDQRPSEQFEHRLGNWEKAKSGTGEEQRWR